MKFMKAYLMYLVIKFRFELLQRIQLLVENDELPQFMTV